MTSTPPTPPVAAVLARAVAFLNAGHVAEAEAMLRDARTRFPANPDVLQLSGAAARRAGRPADALFWLKASLDINAQQPAAWNNLGGALLDLRQPTEAVQAFEQALRLAPNFPQAAQNLGVALTQLGRFGEAVAVLERATQAGAPNAAVLEALGFAKTQAGDADGGLAVLDRALALEPRRASAHHNRGAALLALGRVEDALAALRVAADLRPESTATAFALGGALLTAGQIDEASVHLQRVVALEPGHLKAHEFLNEALWQIGQGDRFAASYPAALATRPNDAALRLQYGTTLKRMRRHDEAIEQAQILLTSQANLAAAHDLMADALGGSGQIEAAVAAAARASALAPDDVRIVGRHGELLLKAGRSPQAIDVLRAALARAPRDQETLARLSVAYRLAGEVAAHRAFSDPETLAVTQTLEPPEGFATIHAFNQALAASLRELHTAKQHPTDQTLRGGTQTLGSLFAVKDPLIQQLRAQLEKAIAKTIADLPDDGAHPFFSRKSRNFGFAGSWSVRLSCEGFHTNHIHPQGWISSAYYINLPEEVSGEGHQGWFKIGETNPDTLPFLPVERWIKPEPGLLVLFPSYMWHGTQPFTRSAERLTVAFDVIPQ